ncbi:MAG: CBS domain-containing protein [Gammaproteobacteria bacterium]|nr:CBS domain-containing protein [Gammaproteobacteria bacterium]
MLIKDIMSTAVRTVTPETPMMEVASIMCLYRISGLPVVTDDDKMVGFIAERDVLHHLFPSLADIMDGMATIDFETLSDNYGDIASLKTSDLMSDEVLFVDPELPILRAASKMVQQRLRRIPVAVEEKGGMRLLGVVSLGDIHKAMFHRYVSKS